MLWLALLVLEITAARPNQAWHYIKDDPGTKKHIARIDAKAFAAGSEVYTFRLKEMTGRLYKRDGITFKQISSKDAIIDEKAGTLRYGPNLNTVVKLTN